jgi:hypothetical protein
MNIYLICNMQGLAVSYRTSEQEALEAAGQRYSVIGPLKELDFGMYASRGEQYAFAGQPEEVDA